MKVSDTYSMPVGLAALFLASITASSLSLLQEIVDIPDLDNAFPPVDRFSRLSYLEGGPSTAWRRQDRQAGKEA